MEVRQYQSYQKDHDYPILKTISAQRHPVAWPRPKSVGSLLRVLELKNKITDPLRQVNLQKNREWLNKKGINLAPILSRLEYAKKHPQPEKDKIKPGSDNYFHVELEDPKNLKEYLQKAQEYGTMNLMQKIMSKGGERKRFTLKYLQTQLSQGPNSFPAWQSQSHPQRKKIYISLVKSVLQRKNDHKNLQKQLLRQFRSSSDKLNDEFLWQMIALQLQAYDLSLPQGQNMTRMFITSLKLIHQEFQRKLHGQDFERYIAKNYVNRAQGRYAFEYGGFWAKVWLSYCLGYQKDVLDMLSSSPKDYKDLMQLYLTSQQSLSHCRPIKHQPSLTLSHSPPDDIFYQQFIYNITGQSRYSCQLMAQSKSLELVLIAVRTLGVYYEQDREKFQVVKRGMMNGYRGFWGEEAVVRNVMYLMGYEEVVKMGPNAIMNNEDYLHFLLVLSGYPNLVPASTLQPLLTKHLTQFILHLIHQSNPDYIYYLPLLPSHTFINEVSSIILSSNMLDSFNWRELQKMVQPQVYTKLVQVTLEKYRVRDKAEVKAAVKIRELLGEEERGYAYLVAMLANHYLHKGKYPLHEIQQAEEIGLQWSRLYPGHQTYHTFFTFITSLRTLLSLLMRRNEPLLRSFISNTQFLDFASQSSPNSRLLNLLTDHHAVELYWYYLRLVVKAGEICGYKGAKGGFDVREVVRGVMEIVDRRGEVRVQRKGGQFSALRDEVEGMRENNAANY